LQDWLIPPPTKSRVTQQTSVSGAQNVAPPQPTPGLFHTPPLLLLLPPDEEDDDEEDEEEEELDVPPLDDDVLEPPLEDEVLGGGGSGVGVPVLGGVDVSPDEPPFAGSVGSENCELPCGPKSSDCEAPLHAILRRQSGCRGRRLRIGFASRDCLGVLDVADQVQAREVLACTEERCEGQRLESALSRTGLGDRPGRCPAYSGVT